MLFLFTHSAHTRPDMFCLLNRVWPRPSLAHERTRRAPRLRGDVRVSARRGPAGRSGTQSRGARVTIRCFRGAGGGGGARARARPCLQQRVLAAGHDVAEEQQPQVPAEAPRQRQEPQQRHQDEERHGQHVFLDVVRSVRSEQGRRSSARLRSDRTPRAPRATGGGRSPAWNQPAAPPGAGLEPAWSQPAARARLQASLSFLLHFTLKIDISTRVLLLTQMIHNPIGVLGHSLGLAGKGTRPPDSRQ